MVQETPSDHSGQSISDSTVSRDVFQIRAGGDVQVGTAPPARRRRGRLVVTAVLAVVFVTAVAFAFTEQGRRWLTGRSGPEVTFKPIATPCGQGWVVNTDETPPDPTLADTRFHTWLEEHDAVRAKKSETILTLTGSSSFPLVIEDIKIIVTERRAPLGGQYVYRRCGGPSLDKHFALVDLDDLPAGQPVSLRAMTASARTTKTRTRALGEVELVQFPFKVTRTDYTYINLIARTEKCDCSWKAEVVWLNGDQRGVERSTSTFRLSGVTSG